MITIYHNPRCSKSREALSLAQEFASESRQSLEIIDYQKTPLTYEQLASLHKFLNIDIQEMMRGNEEEYSTLNLKSASDEELLRALVDYPKLLQRPIVAYRNRAIIGRPTDRIHDLLK